MNRCTPIDGAEVAALFNKGHRVPWLAKHFECGERNILYHLKHQRGLRAEKFKLSPVLCKTLQMPVDDEALTGYVTLTPHQRIAMGLTIRQPGKKIHISQAAGWYWNTTTGLLTKGCLRPDGDWLKATPRGQLSSHQYLPVEIVMKEGGR